MNIASGLLVFVMAFTNSFGQQEPASVKQAFKPGETLHYVITFNSPFKENEKPGIRIFFGLTSEQGKNQPGLLSGFDGQGAHPISATVFEVDSTIPEDIKSGIYELNAIRVTLPGGATRGFNSAADFKSVSVLVVNDKQNGIPDIKSVSPKP